MQIEGHADERGTVDYNIALGARRATSVADYLRAHGIASEVIDVPGSNVLAQQLCGVHLGDWASYYLGVLNGVNPSSMDALERLKKLLASRE